MTALVICFFLWPDFHPRTGKRPSLVLAFLVVAPLLVAAWRGSLG